MCGRLCSGSVSNRTTNRTDRSAHETWMEGDTRRRKRTTSHEPFEAKVIFPRWFLRRSSPFHVLQSSGCHRAPKQQQGEGVGVQQQGPSQPFQGVQRQQTKGFLAQVQAGIEIPDQGVRKGEKSNKYYLFVSYQWSPDIGSATSPLNSLFVCNLKGYCLWQSQDRITSYASRLVNGLTISISS